MTVLEKLYKQIKLKTTLWSCFTVYIQIYKFDFKGREMTQWVKCSHHKNEDNSLDLQKSNNLWFPKAQQIVETELFLKLTYWSPYTIHELQIYETPVSISQVKRNLRKDSQHQFLSITCSLRQVLMHPHAHTHIPIIKSVHQTH